MKKCKFCGADVEENKAFCSTCGAKTDETPTYEAEVRNDAASAQTPSRSLKTGMLVWSITNAILGFCSCAPFILGVISVILTLIAKDATSDEKERQYIKSAKIINIITSILIALSIVIWVFLVAVAALSEIPYYQFLY